MTTEKLYYQDPLLKTFTTEVLSCTETENGYEVTLSATAFYPEGGGQSCDIGSLGNAQVLDVRERGEEIVHLCDKALTPGETVTGAIDWERRLDQMQQHAGEHILSGIMHKLYGCHNTGFHVGAEVVQVDFDCIVPPGMIPKIEEMANAAIYENIPIKCWYPSQEELPTVRYRTKRELPWPVRIVEIPGYDSCACCGVHTATTGQIGVIKILSCTKFHQGVRMETVCGKRAFSYLSRVFDENKQICREFSAKPLETADAARRVNEALAAEKYRSTALTCRLFDRIAEDYVNQENAIRFETDLTPGEVRELADRIAAKCTGWAAVLSGSDDTGYSVCIIGKDNAANALGKALTSQFRGRGGGKPGSFQGSVPATRAEIEDFFGKLTDF